MPAPPTQLRALLERCGYRIGLRRDGFLSVLVSAPGERWLGHGVDEAEALEDAVAQMFPSRAARAALAALLDSEAEGPEPPPEPVARGSIAAAAHPPAAVVADHAEPTPSLDAHAGGEAEAQAPPRLEPPDAGPTDAAPPDEGPPEPDPAAAGDPSGEPAPEAAGSEAAPEPEAAATRAPDAPDAPIPPTSPTGSGASPSAPAEPTAPAAEVDARAPAPDATPTPPPPEAVAAEPGRSAERTPAAPDAASGWGEPDATERLAELEQEIGELIPDVAWLAPARLRLQLTAWVCHARGIQEDGAGDPAVEDRVRILVGRIGGLSRRWWPGNVRALQLQTSPEDAARSVNLPRGRSWTWAGVAEHLDGQLASLDDGWADDDRLDPPPLRPEWLFAETRRALIALIDPRDRRPLSDAQAGELRRHVQRLRWLRGRLDSGDDWATLMGRLRKAEAELRDVKPHLVDLHPQHRPAEAWATVLRQDPSRSERKRARKALVKRTPKPGAAVEDVAAWMWAAFELGDELPTPRIAALLAPHRAALEALPANGTGGSRRGRRRLKKLLEHWSSPEPPTAEAPSASRDEDGEADETAPSDPLGEALRAQLGGKRAVFVTNRGDPDLAALIAAELQLQLDVVDASTRRVQALQASLIAGGTDLVILATGFLAHSHEYAIRRAAESAGVKVVRAYKGRLAAVRRALARDLGITPDPVD